MIINKKIMEIKEYEDLRNRRENMTKETWIKNVLRIYPEKTREQAEELYSKLFPKEV